MERNKRWPAGSRSTVSPEKILEDIRVADFILVIAGPPVTQMMADAGAEVIKIELPALSAALSQWERLHNTVRPHEALA
ncbi:MAG: CoA transferase [Chloroflexi bacterium]|nr:CoA transferase [Chloroflexota bacterium]